jgi:hypothetical protein
MKLGEHARQNSHEPYVKALVKLCSKNKGLILFQCLKIKQLSYYADAFLMHMQYDCASLRRFYRRTSDGIHAVTQVTFVTESTNWEPTVNYSVLRKTFA